MYPLAITVLFSLLDAIKPTQEVDSAFTEVSKTTATSPAPEDVLFLNPEAWELLHTVHPTPETAEWRRRTVSLQTQATNYVWYMEKIMWPCSGVGVVRTRSLVVTGLGLDGYDLHSSPGMWYQDKVRPRLIHKSLRRKKKTFLCKIR